MKFTDLNVGTEYFVLSPWSSHNKADRDATKCEIERGTKAKLVSKDKYAAVVYYDATTATFAKAEKGATKVGYLFHAEQLNRYFVVTAANVVAAWADLEPRWEADKLASAELSARLSRENAIAKAAAERLEQSIKAEYNGVLHGINTALSGHWKPSVLKVNSYRHVTEADVTVQMSLRDLARLVERCLDLQDQLN